MYVIIPLYLSHPDFNLCMHQNLCCISGIDYYAIEPVLAYS